MAWADIVQHINSSYNYCQLHKRNRNEIYEYQKVFPVLVEAC